MASAAALIAALAGRAAFARHGIVDAPTPEPAPIHAARLQCQEPRPARQRSSPTCGRHRHHNPSPKSRQGRIC
jgi:hypothetical protein